MQAAMCEGARPLHLVCFLCFIAASSHGQQPNIVPPPAPAPFQPIPFQNTNTIPAYQPAPAANAGATWPQTSPPQFGGFPQHPAQESSGFWTNALKFGLKTLAGIAQQQQQQQQQAAAPEVSAPFVSSDPVQMGFQGANGLSRDDLADIDPNLFAEKDESQVAFEGLVRSHMTGSAADRAGDPHARIYDALERNARKEGLNDYEMEEMVAGPSADGGERAAEQEADQVPVEEPPAGDTADTEADTDAEHPDDPLRPAVVQGEAGRPAAPGVSKFEDMESRAPLPRLVKGLMGDTRAQQKWQGHAAVRAQRKAARAQRQRLHKHGKVHNTLTQLGTRLEHGGTKEDREAVMNGLFSGSMRRAYKFGKKKKRLKIWQGMVQDLLYSELGDRGYCQDSMSGDLTSYDTPSDGTEGQCKQKCADYAKECVGFALGNSRCILYMNAQMDEHRRKLNRNPSVDDVGGLTDAQLRDALRAGAGHRFTEEQIIDMDRDALISAGEQMMRGEPDPPGGKRRQGTNGEQVSMADTQSDFAGNAGAMRCFKKTKIDFEGVPEVGIEFPWYYRGNILDPTENSRGKLTEESPDCYRQLEVWMQWCQGPLEFQYDKLRDLPDQDDGGCNMLMRTYMQNCQNPEFGYLNERQGSGLLPSGG